MKTFLAEVFIDVSDYRNPNLEGNVPSIFVWSPTNCPLPPVIENQRRYKCVFRLPDHRPDIPTDVFPEQVQVERISQP